MALSRIRNVEGLQILDSAPTCVKVRQFGFSALKYTSACIIPILVYVHSATRVSDAIFSCLDYIGNPTLRSMVRVADQRGSAGLPRGSGGRPAVPQ